MSSQPTTVVRSAILTVCMRWADRLLGFVSTLVLARLLVPADFGIVAMASLVIALADVLFELGVHVALIREASPSKAHYDTAWTLRLLQGLLAAAVVVLAAPFAAGYFAEPRVAPVIQVMALSFVLAGLENIGVVDFQKEMRFGEDFRFLFSKRLAGFLVTLAAAWLLQSYWAMVIGNLAGRAFGVGLSYALHPLRPRPSFAKLGEILGISQWVLVHGIAGYLQRRLHQIVVGGREDSTVMGVYSLAADISAMPSTEVLAPLNRVLFPAFARVKEDLAELKRVFLLAQGVQTLLAMPAAVGLALVARELVQVLLGEKWLAAVPFVQLFALMSFLQAITTGGHYVLITLGKVRLMAAASWFQVALFAFLALIAFPRAGALEIAELRLAVSAAGFLVFVVFLLRHLETVSLKDVIASILRPLLAVAVMVLCVIAVDRIAPLTPAALLLAKVLAGAASYAAAISLLWRLSGRRAGAEAYLLEKLRRWRA